MVLGVVRLAPRLDSEHPPLRRDLGSLAVRPALRVGGDQRAGRGRPAAGDSDRLGRVASGACHGSVSPNDQFLFLYVFDYSSYVDRKNPFCLVDAFIDEFSAEPDVHLLLKVSRADPATEVFGRLMAVAEAHDNITLASEVLDDGDLDSLFPDGGLLT